MTDFFGVTVSRSISHRNCCGIRESTSSWLRGHWNLPSESLLYNRSQPSTSHKPLDMVCASTTEKVKGIRHIRAVPGLCLNKRRKPVHTGAEIRIVADDIDCLKTGSVIKYLVSPGELPPEGASTWIPPHGRKILSSKYRSPSVPCCACCLTAG